MCLVVHLPPGNQLDPNPRPGDQGDLVKWANRDGAAIQIQTPRQGLELHAASALLEGLLFSSSSDESEAACTKPRQVFEVAACYFIKINDFNHAETPHPGAILEAVQMTRHHL